MVKDVNTIIPSLVFSFTSLMKAEDELLYSISLITGIKEKTRCELDNEMKKIRVKLLEDGSDKAKELHDLFFNKLMYGNPL